MEGRMGADFQGVRLHTGEQAARLSGQIGAKGFTRGQHIFMGAGRYDPGSGEGRKLLAHELAHTVQQGGRAGAQAQTVQRSGFLDNARGFIDQLMHPNPQNAPRPGFERHRKQMVNKSLKASGLPKAYHRSRAEVQEERALRHLTPERESDISMAEDGVAPQAAGPRGKMFVPGVGMQDYNG
jgi:hypothetical protein